MVKGLFLGINFKGRRINLPKAVFEDIIAKSILINGIKFKFDYYSRFYYKSDHYPKGILFEF